MTYHSKYWFIFLNDFLFKQSLVEIFETFEKYSSIILRNNCGTQIEFHINQHEIKTKYLAIYLVSNSLNILNNI